MKNKKAVVTITIGQKYENMFDKICRISWQKYCATFSYDLIVIREALDQTDRAKKRSPAWQKLLILSQDWSTKYEQIVWIDADIVINNDNAPDIFADVPIEKVGAVEAYSIPTKEINATLLRLLYEGWDKFGIPYLDNSSPKAYYKNRGIESRDIDVVVQTGVIVCSQLYHQNLFEHIYNNYEDVNNPEWNYEMPAMSFELLKNDLVYWIQPEFNFCISVFCPFIGIASEYEPLSNEQIAELLYIFDLGYFIHFAGFSYLMNPFYMFLTIRASL
jgi:hypothetical protein